MLGQVYWGFLRIFFWCYLAVGALAVIQILSGCAIDPVPECETIGVQLAVATQSCLDRPRRCNTRGLDTDWLEKMKTKHPTCFIPGELK